MSNTRREFFAAGAAAGALAAVPMAAVAAAPARGALPARADFEALLGEAFDVAGVGAMTLLAVRPVEADARLDQFVLVLGSSTAAAGLPAAVHRLHHADTGAFALRLQPSGRDERGHLYRAEIANLA